MNEADIHQILQAKSRDNARSPMQWDEHGGFSDQKPWMEINPNTKDINVKNSIADPDSIFHYYRRLIQLRKQYKIISEGLYEPYLIDHDAIYAFKRHYQQEELIVVNNFYGKSTQVQIPDLDDYEILISNYPDHQIQENLTLRPYETIAFYKK